MGFVCGLVADYNPLMPPYNGGEYSNQTPLIGKQKDDGDDGQISDAKSSLMRRRRRPLRRMTAVKTKNGCFVIAVFLLAIALMCASALLFLPWTIIDHKFADVPVDSSKMRIVEVAKVCKREENDSRPRCYTVADVIDRESTNDIINQFDRNSARRALFFGNFSNDFETEIPLLRPEDFSTDNSDTRLWRIDHDTLLNEYVAAMALMPFLVGSLRIANGSQRVPESALIVGLGGGSLDMFLHSKFPLINLTVYELDARVAELAEQWFGVKNDRRRQTVVGDGIAAIEHHATSGDRFDVVFVDACDTSGKLTCPATPFLTADALNNIKASLKPIGSFVLNVLTATERDEERVIALVQHDLLSVFPFCVRLRMGRQLNSVFTCLPYLFASNDVADVLLLWQQRKAVLTKHFHFNELLENARFVAGKPSH